MRGAIRWVRVGLLLLAAIPLLGRHARPGLERFLVLAGLFAAFLLTLVANARAWRAKREEGPPSP